VFLEKELRGFSPNFHIHLSVSDLYIPGIGPHIFLQLNRADQSWEDRSQTHEYENWDCGSAIPFLGIFASNFRYSVFALRCYYCRITINKCYLSSCVSALSYSSYKQIISVLVYIFIKYVNRGYLFLDKLISKHDVKSLIIFKIFGNATNKRRSYY
jgi:hypothetical protein